MKKKWRRRVILLGTIFALIFFNYRDSVWAEESQANKIYTETFPLNISQPIFQLNISGKTELFGENSLVRAVMVAKDGREHLIYETYWLLSENTKFSFINECEETCILEGVVPDHIRIEEENAKLTIESTNQNFKEEGS